MVWVDIDEPSKDDLQRLADELGLHPLSVEDALDPHQHDKYVHYEHHVFLVGHDVQLDVEDAALRTIELDVFIGERWLVTVRHGGAELMDRIIARWEKARSLAGTKVGVAIYSILDVVVDGYFDTIDRFEAFYDDAADRVFGESPIEPKAHRHWFEMRRALNQFDRIVGPLSDAFATISTQDRGALRTGVGALPPGRGRRAAAGVVRGPGAARAGRPPWSTPTWCSATTART